MTLATINVSKLTPNKIQIVSLIGKNKLVKIFPVSRKRLAAGFDEKNHPPIEVPSARINFTQDTDIEYNLLDYPGGETGET